MRRLVLTLCLAMAAACSAGSSGGPYTATPGPGPVGVQASPCAGTGVAVQTDQMVDLGALTEKPQASVALKRGETLFIGASDCGLYRVPPASAMLPVLQQTQLVGGGFPALGAWYNAAAAGQVTVVVDCSGKCHFAVYRVTVTVT